MKALILLVVLLVLAALPFDAAVAQPFADTLAMSIWPHGTLQMDTDYVTVGEMYDFSAGFHTGNFWPMPSFVFNFSWQLQPNLFGFWGYGYLNQEMNCGSLLYDENSNPNQGSMEVQWDDRARNCNRIGALCAEMSFTSAGPVGATGYIEGFASTFQPPQWYYLTANFFRTVVTAPGIRGDVDGDGQVTWADVDSCEWYHFHEELYHGLYQLNGVNLGRGRTLFSNPWYIDAYLISLWLTNPNDPLVAGLGIGEPITSDQPGLTRGVPATPNLQGNTLTIASAATAVMVHTILPNGDRWQQAGWVENGQIVFGNLPEGVLVQNLMIEAVTINNAAAIDPRGLNNLPIKTGLAQNYPNPFNPTTTISFDLTHSTRVRLDIFNSLGQQITTLLNDSRPAGHHTITFDGSGLSSGTYYYRINIGGFVDTKKMVLMK